MRNFFFLLILFLVACTGNSGENQYQKSFDDFQTYLENTDLKAGERVLFIAASGGCAYCVNKIIDFAKENKGNDKITFVFSYPKKEFQSLHYKGIKKSDENIHLDDNNAYKLGLIAAEPVVLFLSEGMIKEKVEIIPDNIEVTFKKVHDYIK
ncbi:hypothetical protein C9994_01430 [Marivirga lumbricoides]|uniref:Thioredoxin-like fold domain-containing protein n=1 Tax=Marivirga lumbricoides TaxID=1046115 RepID=A0A2T4DVB8_9BACT|nr:hypothetical protein C9994_01430 [Marivirga lumbricoides]